MRRFQCPSLHHSGPVTPILSQPLAPPRAPKETGPVVTRSRYEYEFDPDRRNQTAASVYQLARHAGPRVLDLGSGPGIVSGALARTADKTVTCVDLDPDHLEAAAERGAARTIQSDLTTTTWSEQVAGEQFDVVILADVLEHLVDPAALLTRLRDHQTLAESGCLVISIPNAAHVSILAVLAAGDFPYRPTGLLDETHLRFFTLDSMRRMLDEVGFGITRVLRTTKTLEKTEFAAFAERIDVGALERLATHAEHQTYQFVLRAEPLEQLAGGHLQEENERLRARDRKSRRKLRELAKKHEKLEGDVRRLQAQLDAVHNSSTWRAGRVVVGLPAALRRSARRS
jgi:2-polyprenyl-3-methyl-5-hydroxy-6-metoxy-1,4-benzoquinol methylase